MNDITIDKRNIFPKKHISNIPIKTVNLIARLLDFLGIKEFISKKIDDKIFDTAIQNLSKTLKTTKSQSIHTQEKFPLPKKNKTVDLYFQNGPLYFFKHPPLEKYQYTIYDIFNNEDIPLIETGSNEIMFLSDIHILQEKDEKRISIVTNILKDALKKNMFVVLGGDIFEAFPDINAIYKSISKGLSSERIELFSLIKSCKTLVLRGNHDRGRNNHGYECLKKIFTELNTPFLDNAILHHHNKNIWVTHGQVAITTFDAIGDEIDNKVSDLVGEAISWKHLHDDEITALTKQMAPWGNTQAKKLLEIANILGDIDIVLSGHCHGFTKIQENNIVSVTNHSIDRKGRGGYTKINQRCDIQQIYLY